MASEELSFLLTTVRNSKSATVPSIGSFTGPGSLI